MHTVEPVNIHELNKSIQQPPASRFIEIAVREGWDPFPCWIMDIGMIVAAATLRRRDRGRAVRFADKVETAPAASHSGIPID